MDIMDNTKKNNIEIIKKNMAHLDDILGFIINNCINNLYYNVILIF